MIEKKIGSIGEKFFGGNMSFTATETNILGAVAFKICDPNGLLQSGNNPGWPDLRMKEEFIRQLRKETSLPFIQGGLDCDKIVLLPERSDNLISALETAIQKALGFHADRLVLSVREEKNQEGTLSIFISEVSYYSPSHYDGWDRIPSEFQKQAGIYANWEPFEYCILNIHPSREVDVESIIAIEKAEAEALAKAEAEKASAKRAYAQRCGLIARKYRIPFVNVLRMGDSESAAEKHAQSLKDAKESLRKMSQREKHELDHEIFSCGRDRKRRALESIGVYLGNGDVNHMDFSMLL